ncbi:MFS transporter [Dermabacteraceae bacterium CCM 9520]
MTSAESPSAEPLATPASQIKLLLGAVFVANLGKVTLNPIIAPLSRAVGLTEWQVGVTISAAAVMVVVTSDFWGRKSQSWGRKPVLVTAYALSALSMGLFALVSWLGIKGLVTGSLLFAGFILLRGVGFGSSVAAVAPTVQAYIADITPDEASRLRGMAGIGAVSGMASIAGAMLGGLLSAFGLMAPLLAIPLMLCAGLVTLLLLLKREEKHELIAQPAKISPRDQRVWPFLVAGLAMFTALGFVNFVPGFLIQDRFGYDQATTGLVTGMAMFVSGLGMVFSQMVVVPRCGLLPASLLKLGGLVAFIGFALMSFAPQMWLFLIGIVAVGLGLGMSIPAYVTGPTLLMSREEQGGMAGLINATNGLSWVIAPTAGTLLYGVWEPLPMLIAAVLVGGMSLFVLAHPFFRKPQLAD